MNWSVGEAGALALKAARGAGMSWGQAEEAGFSVRWLQQRGAPGVQALALYLSAYESTKSENAGSIGTRPCPITVGGAISDTAITPPTDLGTISNPILLIPFIAAIANAYPIRLTIVPPTKGGAADQVVIDIFADHFTSSSSLDDIMMDSGNCSIAVSPIHAFQTSVDGGTRVPETAAAAMDALAQLAHRTYAPATEESRQSGAGADADIND